MANMMFEFQKDEWAEEHGIHVGFWHRHNVKVWDGDCDRCYEEPRCIECDEVVRDEHGDIIKGEDMTCGDCQ